MAVAWRQYRGMAQHRGEHAAAIGYIDIQGIHADQRRSNHEHLMSVLAPTYIRQQQMTAIYITTYLLAYSVEIRALTTL